MRLLQSIVGTAFLVIVSSQYVLAQDADTADVDTDPADETLLEEVVVLGDIVLGEQRALDAQRYSDNIKNVISADGMGKLPDRNAAEAVQRIPGVSIERDQGEGRFVAVRGLPAEWSSATINGDRLPTAEEETTSRAIAFDFFPTELIESIEVSKAVTPDMEGDAMGGSVNFRTKTAPEDRVFGLTLGGGYSDKAEDSLSGYSANLLYGDKTDDGRFGFLLNLTNWKRDWATDNFEPRRGSDGIGIRRLELRDYTGTRETLGFNGAAEFNPNEDTKIYVRAMYGTLDDDETHYKHRYRFDKDRVEVQHINDILITEMSGFELGGIHQLKGDSAFDWRLSTYENEFRYGNLPNKMDNSYFVVRFDQKNVGYVDLEDRIGKNYAYNEIDGGIDPARDIGNHLPPGFMMDPSQTRFAWVELYKVFVNEKDKIVAQANWTKAFSSDLEFKTGVKYRDKERIARFSDEFYSWDPAAGPVPTLADFNLIDQPGRYDYFRGDLNVDYASQFSQVVSRDDITAWYLANQDNFVLDEGESALVSNGGALGRNFDVKETHTDAYAMATYNAIDNLTIVGGLRLERTETKVFGQVFIADEGGLQPANNSNSYTSVLPSLHLTYELRNNTYLRGALSRTFARPGFGNLSPGGTYSEADNEFFSGNPDLNPTYSNNIDLIVERYYDDVGIISAGVFYKDITDPIFQSATLGEFNGNTGVTFLRPENGGGASLYGAEFAISRRLDALPGFWGNFGVIANVTIMSSEIQVPDRDDKPSIPRQADLLYNVSLYYDDGRFSTRLALNYKDDFIEEHGSSPDSDTYYGDFTSLDWSASFNVNRQWVIYAELNNINNAELHYYKGDPARPLQVEYYGMRGQLGVKFSY